MKDDDKNDINDKNEPEKIQLSMDMQPPPGKSPKPTPSFNIQNAKPTEKDSKESNQVKPETEEQKKDN